MLTLIRLGDALDNERIVELLGDVWEVSSGRKRGRASWTARSPTDEVLGSVQADVRELAAGMAFISLATPWKEFI